MTPKRAEQRRTKGWRKPEGAISVARPHKWGNPFEVGKTPGVRTNADAVTTATADLTSALINLAARGRRRSGRLTVSPV